jgi:hypothetical protein
MILIGKAQPSNDKSRSTELILGTAGELSLHSFEIC